MPTLKTYETPVLAEWTDYNGHLRDAYYLLIFSYATDALMDHLGLDSAGREASGHSLFTLEVHLNYLHEVKQGEPVEVRTQLLAHDRKRGSELAATLLAYFDSNQNAKLAAERLGIHVNTARQRLATIEDLLGDWSQATRVLEIHVALRLWSLSGGTAGH